MNSFKDLISKDEHEALSRFKAGVRKAFNEKPRRVTIFQVKDPWGSVLFESEKSWERDQQYDQMRSRGYDVTLNQKFR
jgi:hypothetical protein